jgi:hypothetical protein
MHTRHTSQVASEAQFDISTMEGYLAEVQEKKKRRQGVFEGISNSSI